MKNDKLNGCELAQQNHNSAGVDAIKAHIREQLWLLLAGIVEDLAGLIRIAVLFFGIAIIAVLMGYGIHWLAGVATWMSEWVFVVLHAVEYFCFAMDIVGLISGVFHHIKKHF